MLDIKYIRENKDRVAQNARHKGFDADIDAVLALDDKRRELIAQTDQLRQRRNELANVRDAPEQSVIEEGKRLREQLVHLEQERTRVEKEFRQRMLTIPNMLRDSVPLGATEEQNEVLKLSSEQPKFDFAPLDHVELGTRNDLIDLEAAAKVSGSRFYYLKNGAVLLEFALINWVMEKLLARGFVPVTVPVLVREEMMEATGFFPADKSEIYHVNPEDDDLFLIGTSEVPLAGLHSGKPIPEAELPKRYVGFSTCFRREAGSYGKDVHGIIRVHQFDKLEMFSYAHPDKSDEEQDFLLAIEEEILGELGLPYRVVNVASGELGMPAAKKYDCEAWIPSQGRYRELTSCSNCTDYQARRAQLKYARSDGQQSFVHTLNGTAVAIPRLLAAIMENNQTSEGTVRIPEILKKHVNGKEVL